jgi:hypothetical protein
MITLRNSILVCYKLGVFVIIFCILGCTQSPYPSTAAVLPFSTNSKDIPERKVKYLYYYFLGTQSSELAFPYILDMLDTMELPQTYNDLEITWLRYEEGLPTDDPFNEEWQYIGGINSYKFLQLNYQKESDTFVVKYWDKNQVKGQCVFQSSYFEKSKRKSAVLKGIVYQNNY